MKIPTKARGIGAGQVSHLRWTEQPKLETHRWIGAYYQYYNESAVK